LRRGEPGIAYYFASSLIWGISPAQVRRRVLERATLACRQIVAFAAMAGEMLKQVRNLRMRQ
jgi:hypothetical protein